MRLTAALAVAALVIGAGGCGSDGASGAAPTTTSTAPPPVENFTQPAEVEIEIAGHRNVHFTGATTLNVLRAVSPDKSRILTLGPYEGVKSGDWTIHEAFMSLVKFKGDGRYTMRAVVPGEGTQAMRDYAYTVISRAGADGKPTDAARYDVLVEECKVTVERDGIEGRVHCERLADDRGNVVAFTMSWKATGKPRDRLKEAMGEASSTTTSTSTGS